MAFNVRLFGYAGLSRFGVVNPSQLATDSVFQLSQPYLWASGPISSDGSIPVTFVNASAPAGITHDMTAVLRVEIPSGVAIRYEINPPNRSATPTDDSPLLWGNTNLEFEIGWQFSFIEAGAAPSPPPPLSDPVPIIF